MSNNQKKILLTIVAIIVYILFYKQEKKEIDLIRRDYSFTIGRMIESYRLVATGGTRIRYQYRVGNEFYTNGLNPSISDYDYCYDDFSLCDSIFFWIIYSNEDPEKSMIDLTAPIKEGEDPKITRNIYDFEN